MGSAGLRRTHWVGMALLVAALPLSITSCSDSGSDTPSADTLAQAEQLTFDEMYEWFEIKRAISGGLAIPKATPKNVTQLTEFMCRNRYDQILDRQASTAYGVHQVTEVSNIEAQSENLIIATVQYTRSDEPKTHRSQFQRTDDGTWISCTILSDD